jgi:uncharacterized protein YndB with AHSA1/START domain
METSIAEKNLTAEASRERVWDLLGTLIFDSLEGLEKMEIIDENNFRAELKAKAFGIPLTWHLRGEVIDISPPQALSIKLIARSKWTLIPVVQKITFTLNSMGEGKSGMVCVAVAEDLTPLIRWVFLGQVKSLAQQIFDSIEERLKQLA